MLGLSKNKIKWIRSLHLKKNRDDLNLFFVEGEKMVTEALQFAEKQIELIVHTDDFILPNIACEKICVSDLELKQISTLKTPNKAIAILRKNKDCASIKPGANKIIPIKPVGLILVLDEIQDPGNLGTILRIADWFGIKNIVCSNNTVECYNPKVVQASMGAIFRIQIQYTDLHSFLAEISLPIYGAMLQGENVYKMKLPTSAVLLMGNEGKGISEELIPLITNLISIPRFGDAESLNVSVATGILVSEFARGKS